MDSFEKNGVISKHEAKTWINQIKSNESICQNDSKEIKSKILDWLDKLCVIPNKRKKIT